MVDTTKDINQAAILAENEALHKEIEKLKQCKRYGLVWEDHPEALDKKNIIPLLVKDDGLSLPVIADKKQNYLIEGDNYHALKALQHTHRGAIDVIYIDPPYNTGNEFVYNDKIVDKEDSFRHSKWLSFMEKRLKLARELMSDDGVIFISIDDNEQAQLKLLCDAVFGEANFVANIVWVNNYKGRQISGSFAGTKEYILAYKKSHYTVADIHMDDDDTLSKYNESDHVGKFKKGVVLYNTNSKFNVNTRPNLTYSIYYNEESGEIRTDRVFDEFGYLLPDSDLLDNGFIHITPPYREKVGVIGCWRWGREKLMREYKNEIKLYYNQKGVPMLHTKDRLSSDGFKQVKPKDLVEYHGSNGSELLEGILGGKIFDHPKNMELVRYLIDRHTNKSATVLDFFAGSGTTGHAVMELNKEDGGDRNFILCTNNEVSDDLVRTHFFNEGHIKKNNKTEFNKFVKEHPDVHQAFLNSETYESLGIARAVTRERLKRVIEGYTTPKGKDVEGLPNNLTYLKTKEFDKKEQWRTNK